MKSRTATSVFWQITTFFMQSCNPTAKLHKFINLAKKYSTTNRRKT